jgi:glycine/D-amino acid oxidase-like deaminating enzyme
MTSDLPEAGSRSVIVVGGGVFGLTTATELCHRGWNVSLVDIGPVPRPFAASTDISKVVRADYGDDELYVEMCEAALAGWDHWNQLWNAPLYHEDGFLLVTRSPMRPGSFEYDSFALLGRRGHPVERLDPNVRARRFPAWSVETYPDGYLNHRAGWAESGKVIERLVVCARDAGVDVKFGMQFERLLENGARIAGIRAADGRDLHADLVVVAAGAWTPTLLPHLQHVMWATGQPVVHFQVRDPAQWQPPFFPVWAADISRTGWYGFPALPDGTLKVGHHGPGRRVHPDEPRTVLDAEEEWFRDFLRTGLPALADVPVLSTRLCLYCDTFDGDFWIDHDPERKGLVVAAGDSGHAFKFAPILGKVVADVVERRPNRWATRFAWRARVRDSKEAARSD